jgi:hypothetical protein
MVCTLQVYAAARASAEYDPATMLAAFEAGAGATAGSSEQPWSQGGALLQPQQSRYHYHCFIAVYRVLITITSQTVNSLDDEWHNTAEHAFKSCVHFYKLYLQHMRCAE